MDRPARPTRGRGASDGALSTREVLLLTAERLYAHEGLAAVSLRRINREAGQLNASALHYHFGTRDELLTAILDFRMGQVNRRRLDLLDDLRAAGRAQDVLALTDALIRPLSEHIGGAPAAAGSHYLGFLASTFNSAEVNVYRMTAQREDHSLRKLSALFVEALPDLPEALVRIRFSVNVRSVIYSMADWERDRVIGKLQSRMSFDAFIAMLVDMTAAAMSVPPAQPFRPKP